MPAVLFEQFFKDQGLYYKLSRNFWRIELYTYQYI
jgi:hypothetical protein